MSVEAEDSRRCLSGPRVLVVEDSDTLRTTLESQLRDFGCETEGAANGMKAIEACNAGSFDLVLLDLGLPVLDGYRVASVLRARASCPPLIALTGRLTPAEERRCLDSGMAEALQKPVDEVRLRQLVRQHTGAGANVTFRSSIRPAVGAVRPGIGLGALERLRELEQKVGPRGWLAGVLAEFRAMVPHRMRELRLGEAAGQLQRIAEAAHKLTNDASSIGATRLAHLSVQVEGLARAQDARGEQRCAPSLSGLISELAEEVRTVEADLASFERRTAMAG